MENNIIDGSQIGYTPFLTRNFYPYIGLVYPAIIGILKSIIGDGNIILKITFWVFFACAGILTLYLFAKGTKVMEALKIFYWFDGYIMNNISEKYPWGCFEYALLTKNKIILFAYESENQLTFTIKSGVEPTVLLEIINEKIKGSKHNKIVLSHLTWSNW